MMRTRGAAPDEPAMNRAHGRHTRRNHPKNADSSTMLETDLSDAFSTTVRGIPVTFEST
jgi:hypothetical protein